MFGHYDTAVLSRGRDAALHFYHGTVDQVVAPNLIASAPAALSLGSNDVEAFVRGTDGALYWNTWNGWSWSGYKPLGNERFWGTPAVVSLGPSHMQVFVQGTDRALWTKRWNGSTWSQYEQVAPNPFLGSPVPVTLGTNVIVVFVKGTDSALYESTGTLSASGTTWTQYTRVGAQTFAGRPTAGATTTGRIQAFVRGTDQRLYSIFKTGATSNWPTNYTRYYNAPLASDPSAIALGTGQLYLYAHLQTGGIWSMHFVSNSWDNFTMVASNPVHGRPFPADIQGSGQALVTTRGTDDLPYGILDWQAAPQQTYFSQH
jgi:hypothetical protein